MEESQTQLPVINDIFITYSYRSTRKDQRSVMSEPRNNSSAETDDIPDERLKGIEPKMIELINNEVYMITSRVH